MDAFEPYIVFRLILTLLFSGFILYDLIGLVVWYRVLPRFVQRVILLKLLQLRSGRLKLELGLIIVLLATQVWLFTILFPKV